MSFYQTQFKSHRVLDDILNRAFVTHTIAENQLYSALAQHYERVCGESLNLQCTTSGSDRASNAASESRFTMSLTTFAGQVGNVWNAAYWNVASMTKAFRKGLDSGMNCPAGSPTKLAFVFKDMEQEILQWTRAVDPQAISILSKAAMKAGLISDALLLRGIDDEKHLRSLATLANAFFNASSVAQKMPVMVKLAEIQLGGAAMIAFMPEIDSIEDLYTNLRLRLIHDYLLLEGEGISQKLIAALKNRSAIPDEYLFAFSDVLELLAGKDPVKREIGHELLDLLNIDHRGEMFVLPVHFDDYVRAAIYDGEVFDALMNLEGKPPITIYLTTYAVHQLWKAEGEQKLFYHRLINFLATVTLDNDLVALTALALEKIDALSFRQILGETEFIARKREVLHIFGKLDRPETVRPHMRIEAGEALWKLLERKNEIERALFEVDENGGYGSGNPQTPSTPPDSTTPPATPAPGITPAAEDWGDEVIDFEELDYSWDANPVEFSAFYYLETSCWAMP